MRRHGDPWHLALLLGVSLLGACGGGGDGPTDPPDAEPSPADVADSTVDTAAADSVSETSDADARDAVDADALDAVDAFDGYTAARDATDSAVDIAEAGDVLVDAGDAGDVSVGDGAGDGPVDEADVGEPDAADGADACPADPSCEGTTCKVGALSCATGLPVCVDVGNVPNGSSCGAGSVCHDGACGACAAGVGCTPSNPCRVGQVACTTGLSVCAETSLRRPNGWTCGSDAVCAEGICTSCVVGATCAFADDCSLGVISCSSGPSCTASGPDPSRTGDACGTRAFGSCVAGTCVCPTAQVYRDGDCQFGGSPVITSGTFTLAPARASASGSGTTLTISNVIGTFAPGSLVIVHQTQSAAGGSTGQYEVALINDVIGTTVFLDRSIGAYTTSTTGPDRAQIVEVPQFDAFTVNAGATVVGPAWNGTTGGLLMFTAGDQLTVTGTISMNGRGFRGGAAAALGCYRCGDGVQGESTSGVGLASSLASLGGGGGGSLGQDGAGGGGGGYGKPGVKGLDGSGSLGCGAGTAIQPGGVAGSTVGDADLGASIMLGSGGGSGGADEDGARPGAGGSGGGILMVSADIVTVSGAISADGLVGGVGIQHDAACPGTGTGCGMGGGGGGAGGAVRIVAPFAAVGASRVHALGGGGGAQTCAAAVVGGSGGAGRIGLFGTATGTTNPTFDPR